LTAVLFSYIIKHTPKPLQLDQNTLLVPQSLSQWPSATSDQIWTGLTAK